MPRKASSTDNQAGSGIDAVALLESLDEDKLGASIAEAKAELAQAQGKLKALQTLEKVLAFRNGKIKRKSPKMPLRVRIPAYLKKEGPQKPAVIAAAFGVTVEELTPELKKLEASGKVKMHVDGWTVA